MIHMKNYKPLLFKPKIGTYWFIEGDVNKVSVILKEISNNFLTMKDLIDLEKIILKMEIYLDVKSIGLFIYYSRFGFSYSIIKDTNSMLDLYKNHKKIDIYKYIGELCIDDNKITFDNKYKDLLENILKYNL